MKRRRLRVVVLGLSLSSSWGNGHATTYRALLKALAERGHELRFLERDVPWYREHRDLKNPSYCCLAFYENIDELKVYRQQIVDADAVIIGSFVPQGIEVARWILETTEGITAFYDIDTPSTLANVDAGKCEYVSAHQIPEYDIYLSFTGGPTLARITSQYGARAVAPLYCCVDVETYRSKRAGRRWHLGFLGTYSPDRHASLERLLIEPARRLPSLHFVVAGAMYPSSIRWPANVHCIPHLAPAGHPAFYSSIGWALNVTREDMVRAGYSPSVRLFEAAACGAPIISDFWSGLDELFIPGKEIVLATTSDDIVGILSLPLSVRREVAAAARQRILREHTARRRAAELEFHLLTSLENKFGVQRNKRARTTRIRNRTQLLTFPG